MSRCQICFNLETDEKGVFPPNAEQDLWTELRDLERSANSGCSSCQLIFNGIAHCKPEILTRDNVTVRQGRHWIYAERPRLYIRLRNNEPDDEATLEFSSLKTQRTPWPAIGPSNRLHKRTTCEDSIEQALDWIKTCRESHVACQRHGPPGTLVPLPSRILALGEFQSNSTSPSCRSISLKLHVTNPNDRGLYACLSHCWGSSHKTLTTTTETLPTRLAGIEWESLPRLFQHAIWAARRLGYRYLWIDSLCILQDRDDKSDWNGEARRMAQYYRLADITLAAVSASSSEGACIFDYEGITSEPMADFEVSAFGQDGQRHSVFVRDVIKHLGPRDDRFMSEFPLLSRGWVYQERLLSRRVLYFGCREFIWECCSERACQCCQKIPTGHEGIPFKIAHQAALDHYGHLREIENPNDGDDQNYASPSESLVLDLLWEGDPRSLPRPTNLLAPSWSWAAVAGSIIWSQQPRGQERRQSFIRILNDFGTIINPPSSYEWPESLCVAGRLAPATIFHDDDRDHHEDLRRSRLKLAGPDGSEIVVTESHFTPDYDLEGEGRFQVLSGGTVFLLRAARIPGMTTTMEFALVLRKCQSAHQRIGIARIPLALPEFTSNDGEVRDLGDCGRSSWLLDVTAQPRLSATDAVFDWHGHPEADVWIV
ncbi:HET-domain-containing protein [Rhizodiscina lignyota]|uniref:HET-domain-containing protein n=1 Tax=Rhizodiscina lignyota TaxID=1504668 RepID=A0A9P4M0T4_9PEZI|nr:HET-domain-containing protein [Rhizodiscina lignyota]